MNNCGRKATAPFFESFGAEDYVQATEILGTPKNRSLFRRCRERIYPFRVRFVYFLSKALFASMVCCNIYDVTVFIFSSVLSVSSIFLFASFNILMASFIAFSKMRNKYL